ncbi:putative srp receptor beta subunit protein [Phaeoacremonium minimum UCRPA7]|uniref:Signal recognition particle receptor subunit beta n=1 Tax=Phaeoacremonium minimum (strain UCR-PA7) TaxID=1286976 RepID=R8BK67_PHAM7|nr:putative srp receptor beta subunit protein [Phaeoacremonium minimum UCRPA7]EON99715.1 putative srp receptor beta subunit protein [Phaeoacremonium minimum UCRPA7]
MDNFKNAVETIMTPSMPVFVIGIAIVLLVPLILHFYLSHKGSYTVLPSVLLAGPSGAGKTSLLTLFERKAPTTTHTSQTWSAVELAINEEGTSSFRDDLDATGSTARKFLIVDTPGHGKLRHHAFTRLTPPATASAKLKAVVFMVDAAALSEPEVLASTAAYLYDILLMLQKRMGSTKSSKAPYTIPLLIAANKLDLFTALPAALVKSNLEAELGRIRKTRSKGLLDSGVGTDEIGAGSEENDDWLGEYGSGKFSFNQMREFDIDVDVMGGNIQGGDGPGVDKWWTWIGDKI